MLSPYTQTAKSAPPARKPTEYLTRVKIEQLNQLSIFLLAKEGFALKDVHAMLSISELYSSSRVIRRIVGKPIRKSQRQGDDSKTARLNLEQSAMAFQYAKVLEHATTVFGTQRLAEEWLDRPCKHLADNVPLDLIDNSLGFQVVEDYLERVELGVYQ
jgi:putative toxin-antitoxin system antitoxin component (TIGR02293 family)